MGSHILRHRPSCRNLRIYRNCSGRGVAASIAKVIFFVFLVMLVLTLLFGAALFKDKS
jgi:hypothetical protein